MRLDWKRLSRSLPLGRSAAATAGTDASPRPAPPPSVQSWVPVHEVAGGVMLRAGGVPVAAVRVLPAAFGLLSDRERERRVAAVHEALQGLPGRAQLCSLPRPVDLGAYVEELEARLAGAAGPRRSLLAGYLRYVRALAAGGAEEGSGGPARALEHRHYVLLPGEPGASADELRLRAAEFAAALGRADLAARVCDGAELADLLLSFLHPLHAAEERAAAPAAAPRYVPDREGATDGHA